ncbi:MAG: hypothetical protein K0R50_75 [Eubacterium sp.]|jgi:predicted RNA-binding protein (virulence factor B family)|nr:hypothetical protein [Eubacterium sp.]
MMNLGENMIEIGKVQTLKIIRKTQHGVYLNSLTDTVAEDILLPRNQVSGSNNIGDSIEVFVYRDSEDRIIATINKPFVVLGELAVLKVKENTEIGAFLDWGLEKDLFLPFKEQVGRVVENRSYLVGLYVDKSSRLCATMRIYDMLRTDPPYKIKDWVSGTIYSINSEYGAFIAVDNKYHGLIPSRELHREVTEGDLVNARVVRIRRDGKLELSLRQEAFNEMEGDAQKIIERLKLCNGKIDINDSSSPEKIKSELSMSKAAFKRAVGRLLKEGAVKITVEGMELMW